MAVTIKQISQASGVSRGTVDRVLNGRGRVSEETRARVLAVAKRMGYTPNLAGKALAVRKKSYVIGIILQAEGNPFFDEVIKGIRAAEQQLDEYGVRVELKMLKGYDPERQRQAIEAMTENANILALNPIAVETVAVAIRDSIEKNVPVITLNTDIEETGRMCYVGSNYKASGKTACGLLALALPAGGDVLVFSGSQKVLGHRQRVAGFVKEAEINCRHIHVRAPAYIEDDDEVAYTTALALLKEKEEIAGIYVATAGIAGIVRAIKEKGLAGKVKVLCSDIIPATRGWMEEGVVFAAISQQPFLQGYNAVQHAFNYLLTGQEQPDWIAENQIVILQNMNE